MVLLIPASLSSPWCQDQRPSLVQAITASPCAFCIKLPKLLLSRPSRVPGHLASSHLRSSAAALPFSPRPSLSLYPSLSVVRLFSARYELHDPAAFVIPVPLLALEFLSPLTRPAASPSIRIVGFFAYRTSALLWPLSCVGLILRACIVVRLRLTSWSVLPFPPRRVSVATLEPLSSIHLIRAAAVPPFRSLFRPCGHCPVIPEP